MLHRYCSTCRSHLHADDGHSECIYCFGKSNAETTLMGTDCSHYENKNLSSLCSQKKESDSAPRALLFSSSREPVRKKQRGREHQCTEWTPHREASPSSFLNLSSIPLPARATWSRLVGVTTHVITKTPAKAIGRFMVSLVVFECHLCKYKFIQIKLGWALFVTYTIIQSIMRSEMCSLHLTHPSVHTWSSGQPTVRRQGGAVVDFLPESGFEPLG